MSKINFSTLPKQNLAYARMTLLFKIPLSFMITFIIFACAWWVKFYQKDQMTAILGSALFFCLACISFVLVGVAKRRDIRIITDTNNTIYDIYAQFSQANNWETKDVTEELPEDVLDAYFGLRFYSKISERKANFRQYIQRAQVISGSTSQSSFKIYYLYETPSYLFKSKIGKFVGFYGPAGFVRVNNDQIRYIITGTLLDYEMKGFFIEQLGYTE